MNRELMEALDVLEKEKNISKDTLLEAIEQSLIQACKTTLERQITYMYPLIRKPVTSVCMQTEQ